MSLIEKAAKAIFGVDLGDLWEWEKVANPTDYLNMARAALAVFEEANTPTDDEQTDLDDLEAMIKGSYDLCHIPGAPILSMIRELRTHRTVQGEPSDAAVLAALNAENPRAATDDLSDWGDSSINRMRAALRAAATEGGERDV